MTTESTVFFSGGLTDALSLSLYDSHEGPHRGGAGKGGWGKPGDEAKAPQESNEDGADAPEPEPEEPDNEVTIDDYEKEKAAKKAAIAAAFAKKGESEAKPVDESAFASMTLAAKADDSVNEFALANGGAKAKRDRERTKAEKKVVDTGFRTAPSQDADDRPARGGRGGRGGRGDRDSGRGRGGRGGDRPARAPAAAAASRRRSTTPPRSPPSPKREAKERMRTKRRRSENAARDRRVKRR